jgi:hypothetical protein
VTDDDAHAGKAASAVGAAIYCSVTRASPIRVATVRKSMGNMTMNHMAFLH